MFWSSFSALLIFFIITSHLAYRGFSISCRACWVLLRDWTRRWSSSLLAPPAQSVSHSAFCSLPSWLDTFPLLPASFVFSEALLRSPESVVLTCCCLLLLRVLVVFLPLHHSLIKESLLYILHFLQMHDPWFHFCYQSAQSAESGSQGEDLLPAWRNHQPSYGSIP